MRLVLQRVEEVFTFTSPDGSIHIRSGQLRKFLHEHAMHKLTELTFPEEPLNAMFARHGIEADRLASMTEEEAKEPVIVGILDAEGSDGATHILIDGNHRVVWWAQRGVHVLRGWAVPQKVWSAFYFDPTAPNIIRNDADGRNLPQRRK